MRGKKLTSVFRWQTFIVLFILILHIMMTEVLCENSTKKDNYGEIHSRSNVGEDTCTTLASKNGACVPPIRCRLIWGRSMPDLTNSTCGEEKSENICCPLADDEENTTDSETTTMKLVTTLLTTTIDTAKTSPQNESNGSSFRNRFQSFPENCGQSGATFTRIVGGQDSALNAWPWMAVIYLIRRGRRSPECGGALITSSHILTAAHCIVTSRRGNTLHPRQLLIRLGELDLDSNDDGANPIDIKVRSIIKHEQFNLRNFQNDVAILELEHSVDFSEAISPICIPFSTFSDDDLSERNAIAAGWGSTRFDGPGSPKLQEVQLRIWRNAPCREVYRRDVPITKGNLCAGDGDKDACTGDSGGPLMLADSSLRFYVIGIVSFGKKCAEPGVPGVYARVTTYLDWIEQKVG